MIGNGELRDGMKVRTRDGHELGKIIRSDAQVLLIEKGFFFPKDYEVPISLVSEVRDGEAWLSATRDELTLEGGQASLGGTAGEERLEDRGERWRGDSPGGAEEQRLTLSEEELQARKRVRDTGEVRVTKDVVTERRQVDVPVMREEVHVERVPASASSEVAPDAFREETISVPVREEEVEVTKRPRVREEVRVSKTPHVEERRVEGEVRREEARVERTDDDERGRIGGRDDRGGGILGLGRDDER
jgi:uncharacterized protein (TIGR02271 family)